MWAVQILLAELPALRSGKQTGWQSDRHLFHYSASLSLSSRGGGGGGGVKLWRCNISHLVELLMEKPGTILTWVRFPCMARIFLPESAVITDCLAVSVQPPCTVACSNLFVRMKIPSTVGHTIMCGTTFWSVVLGESTIHLPSRWLTPSFHISWSHLQQCVPLDHIKQHQNWLIQWKWKIM